MERQGTTVALNWPLVTRLLGLPLVCGPLRLFKTASASRAHEITRDARNSALTGLSRGQEVHRLMTA